MPELRDLRVLVVAAATLVGSLLIHLSLLVAILASIAVVVAYIVFRRLTPGDTSVRSPGVTRFGGLSRREAEIAKLVGALSNKEIASRLFISERTVDNHVQHIFNKLDVHTRAQIAVWASQLTAPQVEGDGETRREQRRST